MSAATLRLDDDSASQAAGRSGDPVSESPSDSSAPTIDELRAVGTSQSLQWSLAGTQEPSPSVPCRKAISTLIKHATAGIGALGSFLPEDAEWLVDNVRLVHTALNEVVETRRASLPLPHVRKTDGSPRPRSQVIADSYCSAVSYRFNAEGFSVYLDGWQQNQALNMSELWALKAALQMSVLSELGHAVAPMVFQSKPVLLTTSQREACAIPVLIRALEELDEVDWTVLFEQASAVDNILSRDPALAYSQMTKESRLAYQTVIAELAKRSSFSECQVADAAVSLARAAVDRKLSQPDISSRQCHVGYYLVDVGISRLRSAIGYRPGITNRLEDLLRAFPNSFYLVGIEILVLVIVSLVLAGVPRLSPIVASFFLILIPASQTAVELANATITSLLRARALPKLDFSEGIPDEYKTIMAVPALLFNKEEVQRLLSGLEIRYLANRDPNLYFALLTDGPDSNQPFDGKEALADFCARGIRDLNRKYGVSGKGPFFLLHRPRTFNTSQNTWMGWERKRGKLLDLTRLLSGDQDRFSIKVGDLQVLPQIRYVITLDADTQLPRDAAHRLVGTLAHPLNRAVVDPVTNIVSQGYGILQPRVGIGVHSASRSWLASIYSGQTGFDIYTRAVSDVYQDLYGEGIFAGKGIFDVKVFRQVLNDRFPCNTLLSHDLIEGAYARAALASDIEVIEDYPSHFSAYTRRKHRWVRGDWQISQWLFPRVPDYSGRFVPNPIGIASRWKIFDNLRRSLVDPALLALLLGGWFFLPGRPWYWTAVAIVLLVLPAYAHGLFALLRTKDVRDLPASMTATVVNLARGHLNVLVTLTFLPHQALVMMDAIVRTVIRHRITGRRLLEWETAAEAELGKPGRRPADTYLAWTPALALGLAIALAFVRPQSSLYALPFLLVWAASPSIAKWLSREKTAPRLILTPSQKRFLRSSALHIWTYFKENSGPGENWLIPDNVQENLNAVAHRTSPTNLGLLLNARQAAYEMGYLTLPEFVESTKGTLAAMTQLPQHRGHFLNWYDTLTLRPIHPAFVSTVDSGNLAASLWALKQSCISTAKQPIFSNALWHGVRDYVLTLRALDRNGTRKIHSLIREFGNDGCKWLAGLDSLEQAAQPLAAAPTEPVRRWAAALLERIFAVRGLALTLAPWLAYLKEEPVRDLISDPATLLAELTLGRVSLLADHLRGRLDSPRFDQLCEQMLRAAETAENLEIDLRRIASQADQMVSQMDFSFLHYRRKTVLSVGYNVETQELERASYGLLASEARTAAFIAIAKGDVPQDAWSRLGRAQTRCAGRRVLLSWTGTMFEYLMPSLWMRHYPQTLLEQNARAVVEVQRAYCRKMRMPWGISESAYSVTDASGFYQYRAFGIPGIAMKRIRTQPRIIAPYAAYLALAVQPVAAIRNLRRIRKRGWWGRYGPYEAVDFNEHRKPAAVRCWMAHHHAMSLMAITNCLCESPFQRLFHAEPQVLATELLLHEKVSAGVRVRTEPRFEPPVSLVTAPSAACQTV